MAPLGLHMMTGTVCRGAQAKHAHCIEITFLHFFVGSRKTVNGIPFACERSISDPVIIHSPRAFTLLRLSAHCAVHVLFLTPYIVNTVLGEAKQTAEQGCFYTLLHTT